MTTDFAENYELFREKLFVYSHDFVELVTAPISFVKDRKSEVDRTGVLLQIGEQFFIITAQHDLREILDHGYLPCIPTMRPGMQEIPLLFDNLWYSTTPNVDIAIFVLNTKSATRLKEDYRFLRLGDVRLRERCTPWNSYYLVTGDPVVNQSRDNEGRKVITSARYLTYAYCGEVSEETDPRRSLLLEYSRESRHTDGRTGCPPMPKGLSGCGVWEATCGGDSFLTWNPKELRLVGIQVAWSPKRRYLKVTWIDEALAMIWNQYRKSRDLMQLVGIEF